MIRGFALAALSVLGACHRNCTLIGFENDLTVMFEEPLEEGGHWAIELGGGGSQNALCVLELPHQDGDIVSCSQNAALILTESGVAGLTVFNFTANGLWLQTTRDGQGVGTRTFEVDYTVTEPNGEGCGERHVGEVTVALPTGP